MCFYVWTCMCMRMAVCTHAFLRVQFSFERRQVVIWARAYVLLYDCMIDLTSSLFSKNLCCLVLVALHPACVRMRACPTD